MTGLDRLRDLASCLRTGASVSLWWLSTVAYSEEHGLDFRNTGPEVPDVLREIADQIEAEQEERATRRVEDREAAAWVRGQGGLERVKGLLDWVVGYCSTKQQLDFDFWLSGRVMHELGFEGDMADRDEVERRLLARLMPEGMEWLIEAWPKFEDDAPVKLGDMALVDGDAGMVEAVQIWIHGKPVIYGDNGSRQLEKGERVKRPATKVLDADGAEIREKRDVWWICEGDERGVHAERLRVETICPNGLIECSPHNGGTWVYLEPSELYVNKPVPASDGKLRDCWSKMREKLTVKSFITDAHGDKWADFEETSLYVKTCYLTHAKPELDSWERIEEDAGCTATKYNERRGTIFTTKQQVARDLVRRCRALAERERGE